MTTRIAALLTASIVCSAASLVAPAVAQTTPATSAAAADPVAAAYRMLAEKVGPALVSVKFTMKIEGMGDDAGRESETNGVLVDPAGLVLVSNAKIGGMAARMGMTANPTDIKVFQGDDAEGLKGRVIARDTELDLAWIQIDDDKAKGKTFPAVDPAAGTMPAVGDKIMVVDRMGKFFDNAVVIEEARVGGLTTKPRKLIIPSGMSDRRAFSALGMPMFAADGRMIGVSIIQMPGKEDMEGGGEMGEGNAAIAILPASEVAKATARGKEAAAKAPAAAEGEKKDDAPADAPTDGAEKK
jgi:hypothetical protein